MNNKIILLLISIVFYSKTFSQVYSDFKIDGDSVVLIGGNSFPYWLNSGQTIELIGNTKKVSAIEFKTDTSGTLSLYKILSLNQNNIYTVPIGKSWKIEGLAFTNERYQNLIGNSGGSTSFNLQVSTVKTFTGYVQWGPTEVVVGTVPQGRIWKIEAKGFSGNGGVLKINGTPYYNYTYAYSNAPSMTTINESIWLKGGDVISYVNTANTCYYCSPIPYVISVIEFFAP